MIPELLRTVSRVTRYGSRASLELPEAVLQALGQALPSEVEVSVLVNEEGWLLAVAPREGAKGLYGASDVVGSEDGGF